MVMSLWPNFFGPPCSLSTVTDADKNYGRLDNNTQGEMTSHNFMVTIRSPFCGHYMT